MNTVTSNLNDDKKKQISSSNQPSKNKAQSQQQLFQLQIQQQQQQQQDLQQKYIISGGNSQIENPPLLSSETSDRQQYFPQKHVHLQIENDNIIEKPFLSYNATTTNQNFQNQYSQTPTYGAQSNQINYLAISNQLSQNNNQSQFNSNSTHHSNQILHPSNNTNTNNIQQNQITSGPGNYNGPNEKKSARRMNSKENQTLMVTNQQSTHNNNRVNSGQTLVSTINLNNNNSNNNNSREGNGTNYVGYILSHPSTGTISKNNQKTQSQTTHTSAQPQPQNTNKPRNGKMTNNGNEGLTISTYRQNKVTSSHHNNYMDERDQFVNNREIRHHHQQKDNQSFKTLLDRKDKDAMNATMDASNDSSATQIFNLINKPSANQRSKSRHTRHQSEVIVNNAPSATGIPIHGFNFNQKHVIQNQENISNILNNTNDGISKNKGKQVKVSNLQFSKKYNQNQREMEINLTHENAPRQVSVQNVNLYTSEYQQELQKLNASNQNQNQKDFQQPTAFDHNNNNNKPTSQNNQQDQSRSVAQNQNPNHYHQNPSYNHNYITNGGQTNGVTQTNVSDHQRHTSLSSLAQVNMLQHQQYSEQLNNMGVKQEEFYYNQRENNSSQSSQIQNNLSNNSSNYNQIENNKRQPTQHTSGSGITIGQNTQNQSQINQQNIEKSNVVDKKNIYGSSNSSSNQINQNVQNPTNTYNGGYITSNNSNNNNNGTNFYPQPNSKSKDTLSNSNTSGTHKPLDESRKLVGGRDNVHSGDQLLREGNSEELKRVFMSNPATSQNGDKSKQDLQNLQIANVEIEEIDVPVAQYYFTGKSHKAINIPGMNQKNINNDHSDPTKNQNSSSSSSQINNGGKSSHTIQASYNGFVTQIHHIQVANLQNQPNHGSLYSYRPVTHNSDISERNQQQQNISSNHSNNDNSSVNITLHNLSSISSNQNVLLTQESEDNNNTMNSGSQSTGRKQLDISGGSEIKYYEKTYVHANHANNVTSGPLQAISNTKSNQITYPNNINSGGSGNHQQNKPLNPYSNNSNNNLGHSTKVNQEDFSVSSFPENAVPNLNNTKNNNVRPVNSNNYVVNNSNHGQLIRQNSNFSNQPQNDYQGQSDYVIRPHGNAKPQQNGQANSKTGNICQNLSNNYQVHYEAKLITTNSSKNLPSASTKAATTGNNSFSSTNSRLNNLKNEHQQSTIGSTPNCNNNSHNNIAVRISQIPAQTEEVHGDNSQRIIEQMHDFQSDNEDDDVEADLLACDETLPSDFQNNKVKEANHTTNIQGINSSSEKLDYNKIKNGQNQQTTIVNQQLLDLQLTNQIRNQVQHNSEIQRENQSIYPTVHSTVKQNSPNTSYVLQSDSFFQKCQEPALENKAKGKHFNLEDDSIPSSIMIIQTPPKKGSHMRNQSGNMNIQNRDIKKELQEFDQVQKSTSSALMNSDTLSFLISREPEYSPDPFYFEHKQSNITSLMRTILFDWIMEVCMEFTLKRETFHIAINIVDRYLSQVSDIMKQELQLIGVAAMYIASKIQEIYPPKLTDFVQSADNGYSSSEIRKMELTIMQVLQWLVNPPTINMWINWYMSQWDLYVENSPYALNHPLFQQFEQRIQFKQPNEKSYAYYREVMQIIDAAYLDVETLLYQPRVLTASLMYLVLGKHSCQFTQEEIVEEFPQNSLFIMDPDSLFNDLFADFLEYSFGFSLIDLLPTIQYLSSFFILQLNFDLPTAAQINRENVLEGHFEEFLAYQTHHPNNIQCIQNRTRKENNLE